PPRSTLFPSTTLFRSFRDGDLTLDEPWSIRGESGLETLVELFGRSRPGCGHAETGRDIYPVERRIAKIQHRLHLRVHFAFANSRHLEVENGVGVVLEDDDDDVGFFSRHRPQRLH